MKRAIIGGLSAALLLSLVTACSNTPPTDAPTFEEPTSETEPVVTQPENTESGGDEAMVSDEEQILAVYERMQQAMVDKDTDTLREMMGANTTVQHITGRTQTMDEWLSDVENEEMKYYSIEVTEPKIEIDGDTATLTCSNVIEARIYGSHGTWTLPGGATFEKINGE